MDITIDNKLLEKTIKEVFLHSRIIFAYLFGSQVTGHIGKLSDIDIAIYFDEKLNSSERIIRDGVVIFSIDENKRIDYEVKAVMRYLDFKPYIEKYTKESLYDR